MHEPRTDFVIADNAHVRWVRRSHGSNSFVTTEERHATSIAQPQPQGVVFESGGARFNIEERRAARANRHYRFAKTVAGWINAKAGETDVQRLCLVAPSRTLAAIRRQLSLQASAKLVRVLDKDLTKTPDHKLGDWLQSMELDGRPQ